MQPEKITEWLQSASDADCRNKAEELAKQCRDFAGSADPLDPLQFAIASGWLDEAMPLPGNERAYLRALGLAKRVQRPEWWRKQLMRRSVRAMESREYAWGYIGKTGAYISRAGLERMAYRKQRSDAAIAGAEVISPDGEAIPLQQIIEGSIANPKNKRLELVVRMKGIAEWAQRGGYVAYAVTLTAPGAYHRLRTVEDQQGNKRLVDNPRWEQHQTNPQAVHRYLCDCWANYRAKLAKLDIKPVGLRTVEPHKDGTPHWHLVLFFKPQEVRAGLSLLKKEFLATLGDEKGASKRRVLCERIKPKKGQDMVYAAVAYAIGYISKNIDGAGVKGDTEAGIDAANGAQRATIWARLWGIRQFQTFGAPSITIWRELRRVRDEVAKVLQVAADHKNAMIADAARGLLAGTAAPLGRAATEAMRGGHADVLSILTDMRNINLAGLAQSDAIVLGECWKAADAGQFRRFMHAMEKTPVSLLKEERQNRYGEPVKIIRGLVGPSGESVLTHEEGWTVRWGKGEQIEVNRAQPGRGDAQHQPLGLVALTVTGEAGAGFDPQEYAEKNPITGGWSWGNEHAAHVEHLISEHRAGWPAHFSP